MGDCHIGVAEDLCLQGCYSLLVGEYCLMFQTIVLLSSSGPSVQEERTACP